MFPITTPSRLKHQSIIRPAEPKDIPAISSLLIKTFTSTFGHAMSPKDLQAYIQKSLSAPAIETDFQNPQMEIFVACDGEQVMGMAQLTRGSIEPCLAEADSPIELQRLYVDKEYHGRGAGGALFRHTETLAKQRGFKTLWLGVWEENHPAIRAYQRFGLKKIGIHDFVIGEQVDTDWIMSKEL